jgi:ABC-2 type transport system ATP-binding protein
VAGGADPTGQRRDGGTVTGEHRTVVPAVHFEHVRKVYRRGRRAVEALRGLSVAVDPGEIAALVGPNGSGKTTALRIAAALVSPSSGTCSVFGCDVRGGPRETRSLVGISLGSERSFYWRLSAFQNLAFFAAIVGMRRADARDAITRLAAELDIERFLQTPARQLSRGALARLSVARACLGEPRLLLLDEPFASVDERGREVLWLALRRRTEAGRSVLLTTHEAALARRCGVTACLRSRVPRRSM